MSPTLSPTRPARRPSVSRRGSLSKSSLDGPTAARRRKAILASRHLDDYVDDRGRKRELLAVPGYGGSLLVLDRDAATLCDRRLIAHLAADEPPGNAALVCGLYLGETNGRWCRPVRPEDLEVSPFAGDYLEMPSCQKSSAVFTADRTCSAYSLRLLACDRRASQLRWCRRPLATDDTAWKPASLREVIAALESYEPVRTLTEYALAHYRHDQHVSRTRLSCEFDRLCSSPIVLNRGLREAVLSVIERDGTSMSEIALRCGVVKRDRRGRLSGETSWLARRIGIMPEGGASAITPWVHSDVLGTIARNGLGISPREVELQ